MNKRRADSTNFMRLNFELDRDENPRLFDDLARFNKGVKRLNRLRALAQDGLLVQAMPAGTFPRVEVHATQQATTGASGSTSLEGPVTGVVAVFGEPAQE